MSRLIFTHPLSSLARVFVEILLLEKGSRYFPPQTFVDSIKSFQPAVVGLSGFLTLAFDSMKVTVDAIAEAGLRDQVKIMIGGGVIDEGIKTYTGADA